MGDGPSPAVARRRLRIELRNTRLAIEGLTQEAVAEAMVWHVSKIIRIEQGQVTISVNDLKALLSSYGVTDEAHVAELVELAKLSRQRSWWDDYSDVLQSGPFRQFIEFESAASSIRGYQPVMVPGLLQTEAYAENVIPEFARNVSRATAEKLVRLRMRRQELIDREDGPSLHFVLDEAPLHRLVGDASVMRRQLSHLVDLATRPNLSIHVVPFTMSLNRATQAPFVLAEFGDATDDDVLFLETFRSDLIVRDDHGQVSEYRRMFKELQERSLGPGDSIAKIRTISDEFA